MRGRMQLGVRAWLLLLFLRHENSVLVEYYPVKLKTREVCVSHKCHPRNGPTEKYSSSFALESPGWDMTFSSLSTTANQRGSWRDSRISRRFPSQREWLLSGCCSASDFVIDRALIFWLWSCTSAQSWLYLCELSVLFLPSKLSSHE